jgi:hypothetical protein
MTKKAERSFPLRKLIGVLVLAALAAGRGDASPSKATIQPIGEGDNGARFAFRVSTPEVSIADDPMSGVAVRIDGFVTPERRQGAPDLPTRIVRIAIPPGVVPRLEVIPGKEDVRPGVRPRAVPTVATDLLDETDLESVNEPAAAVSQLRSPRVTRHELRVERPEWFTGSSTVPAQVAWLGEIGVLRDQRYVEVYLAPARFDPRIDGLRVASDFQVVIHFDGDNGARSAPVEDPRFEGVYRNAFANYAEGTTFRLSALSTDTSQTAASLSAFATGPFRRIKIRQNGVVRLDFTRLSGTTGFLTANLSTWRLTNRGVEVPLEVKDVNGNDLMDAGDWIQFYGQALDDEPKTALNTDLPGTPSDIFEVRDFTDENVYFLTTETGVGHSRMAVRPADPTNTRTPPTDFQATAHAEIDSPTGYKPLGGNDPWYWSPSLSNPSEGGLLTARTDSVGLPGLASPTATAQVTVKLRGLSEEFATVPDHHSRITLRTNTGTSLATNNDNGTFDGRTIYVHDFSYPGTGAGLTNPAQITIEALSVAGSAQYANQFILDWIEIRYRRSFQASSDGLTFDYPDGDAEFIVSGLSSSTPEIFEITGKVAATGVVNPVRLSGGAVSGAGPFSVRFRVDNDPAIADGTPRRFVVFGAGAIASLTDPDFTLDTVSDLKTNSNQADMIVIAHPTVLGAASQATLNQLLAYHATKGVTSRIVMMQDIADEFGDGLAGPVAIRNFLAWVMSTNPGEGWANPKPAYVMILGDGSYDYKAGESNGNFVPTQLLFLDDPSLGYYASDNVLAAIVGNDQLADLIVGRIVARTDAEANVVLTKILNYQQAPPAGNWRQHVTFASDRGKRDEVTGAVDRIESAEFEAVNDAGEALMPRPPYNVKKLRYWSDFCDTTSAPPESCNPNAMNLAIRQGVNGQDGFDGAAIFQYTGHGNFDIWSDDDYWDNRLPNPDPETLTNGTKLPWLLAHGCLIGGFHTTQTRSMGENWLKRSGGGAVAVFGPSGLTFEFASTSVTTSVFGGVFGGRKERVIGEPVMDSLSQLCGQGSTQGCQMYTLMGDPAMDLVFPSVSPASNVQAAPGLSQQLTITWTASTSPSVTYNVYRTTNLASASYTKANPSPLTGTSYVDTGLTNATPYYYYVVATNTLNFDSRWSNFNSDCPVSGPDCVKGTPINPNAPASPTGLAIVDPETGGRLNLTWAANPETDLSFYTVHYGTVPGVYTVHVNTAKAANASLYSLANGTRYYFAITATNSSNRTSLNSTEQSAIPTWVRGVKSPQVIGDLRLAKSGADIVVSWNAVTTNIYGNAATISRYEVYRGTTLIFIPGPSNLISLPSLTGTSFTDVGALTGGTNYFYLVRAVDSQGNGSGLGNQLPMGIDAMTVVKSTVTPGNIVLTWPAVTTAFTSTTTPGSPLVIDRYEVYARSTLFTRANVRDNLVPLLTSTSGVSIDLTPPAGTQYYSVVAVDARGNKSPF